MRRRTASIAAVLVAIAGGSAGCGGGSASRSDGKPGGAIAGAGATFPQPLYKDWAKRFKDQTGTTVTYEPVGSGAGIAQFAAGTADFGASDAPMNGVELRAAAKKGQAVHIPTVLGSVAVAYNVTGLGRGLRLDGATLADVFLGRVRRWDDPRIRALNPGTRLPRVAIRVVHRSDASGTAQLFTEFLARSSSVWARSVGSDKAVRWPAGTGAAQNAGVAAAVKATSGAVGFVEQAYASQNALTTAAIRNRAGTYVVPSVESTAAAGAGLAVPPDLRFSGVDRSRDPRAYPIASATFLLVYQDMCRAGKSRNTAQLVDNWAGYALTDGQRVAAELQYAPLPAGVLAAARAKLAGLTCNHDPLKPRR